MGKIKIVTDSTADLPKDLIEQYNISVVPLRVHMEDQVYRDGIDISPSKFYTKLRESENLPTTSQPSPGEFKEVYEKLGEDGSTIISIHLSSKFSGTYQSAILAKQMLDNLDITVIDSETTTLALGLIVLNTAKAITEGKAKAEVIGLIRKLMGNSKIYFAVDTLEYLEKGGRIGAAQALMGYLLNIKPILTIAEGIVTPVEKVRGQKKAFDRLVQLAGTAISDNVQVAFIHGDNLEGINKLKEKLAEEYGVQDFLISDVGPVVGTHVGPGVVAVVIQTL